MQRETPSKQAADRLGIELRRLQTWASKGHEGQLCPHEKTPTGRYRFDVGEVRSWAVHRGLLSASDTKAVGKSKSGRRTRNTRRNDSKSKPAKPKSTRENAKQDPPTDEQIDALSPDERRKLANQILAKIPVLLGSLSARDGSTHASQIATSIKTAEAAASALLRRLDQEAERDADLIERRKAMQAVVEIGATASSIARAWVMDLADHLYEDLRAEGVDIGQREQFVRITQATVREVQDRQLLQLGETVRRAEARLNA